MTAHFAEATENASAVCPGFIFDDVDLSSLLYRGLKDSSIKQDGDGFSLQVACVTLRTTYSTMINAYLGLNGDDGVTRDG
jgi:hypothetical protein